MKKDQQKILNKLMNGEYDKYIGIERKTPLKKWWDTFEKEVLEVESKNDLHIFTTNEKINQVYGNNNNNEF